jgi:hypothetical protein
MQLDYDRPGYKPGGEKDGPQHPLVLIGSDVYGLRDKPLQPADIELPVDSACQLCGTTTHCSFSFLASTDSVLSARNFLVRDPAWDSEGVTGTIAMSPAFTKIEPSAKAAKSDDDDSDKSQTPGCPKKAPDCKPKPKPKPSWFLLSGTNLSQLKDAELIAPAPPADAKHADSNPAKSKPTESRTKSKPANPNPVNTESTAQAPQVDFLLKCENDKGCLQITADSSDGTPTPVKSENVRFVSDNKIWLELLQPVGVHVFWSRPGQPASEWDLAIKKEDKAAVTADPAVLYVADSRAVTFTGADFSSVTQVLYEDKKLDLPVPPTKSKLVVQVTTLVTAKFGHKELLAHTMSNGKDKTISLPLDVVKH